MMPLPPDIADADYLFRFLFIDAAIGASAAASAARAPYARRHYADFSLRFAMLACLRRFIF